MGGGIEFTMTGEHRGGAQSAGLTSLLQSADSNGGWCLAHSSFLNVVWDPGPWNHTSHIGGEGVCFAKAFTDRPGWVPQVIPNSDKLTEQTERGGV